MGIIVGVTAVIAVVTIIKGLDQTVAQTFSSQGSTVFTISKNPLIIKSREEFVKFNRRKDVTHEDAEAIARLCTACWRVGVAANAIETVKYADQKAENVRIRGVDPITMFDIDGVSIDVGRIWTESEGASGREICVDWSRHVEEPVWRRACGQGCRTGDQDRRAAVSRSGRARTAGFDIRLLARQRDLYSLFDLSKGVRRQAFARRRLFRCRQPSSSKLRKIRSERSCETVAATRVRRSEDEGFALETQDVFLNLYGSATSNIYIVTIGVAAISLVVGGIVVMNIMLVSVTERTKEIGIRKAIGARRKDILTQFLIEAVTVTAIGGAIGVGTGFGLAYVISALIGFPLLISVASAVLGVGVSSVVGIVSGLWPAWRAAKLDPIEALRAE